MKEERILKHKWENSQQKTHLTMYLISIHMIVKMVINSRKTLFF